MTNSRQNLAAWLYDNWGSCDIKWVNLPDGVKNVWLQRAAEAINIMREASND